MRLLRRGQAPFALRGPIGGGMFGGGANSAAPVLELPQVGQLCPVGLPFEVRATVPAGATVTATLGANPPVALSVVGNLATGTLTPAGGDAGTAVDVVVTVGGTELSTTVDVEANLLLWLNSSIPESYEATGSDVDELKNLITGVATTAKVGAPKLVTDPRISKPAFYFDGAAYFYGDEASLLAALGGTNLPFTTIFVCAGALATASMVPFAAASSASIGNGKVFGQSAGDWFGEILGSPNGPARVAEVFPVTAGISVVVIHSANSLTIAGSANGGAEGSEIVATVSPPALTPNRLGFGVQPSSVATFPFTGLIYELIACGVDKTAQQIAAMVDRCVRFWRALAPQVIFVGDSITTAQLATNGGMPTLLAAAVAAAGGVVDPDGPLAVGQPQPIRHSASSGNTCAQMNTRILSAAQGLGSSGVSDGYYSRAVLACLFAGTNISGTAAATAAEYSTLLGNIATRLASSQPANWRIAVTPITPISGSTYPEELNALLPAIWDAFDAANPGHELIRWNAYAALPFNPVHYVDTTHPNDAGYVQLCNDPTNGLFQAIVPFLMTVQPPV